MYFIITLLAASLATGIKSNTKQYVFENIMNRYGFEKLYIDSEIKSLFIYTGKKSNLINNYPKVLQDLILAEKKRKIYCTQNFIKLFIPNNLLSIIRKIRNKRINY